MGQEQKTCTCASFSCGCTSNGEKAKGLAIVTRERYDRRARRSRRREELHVNNAKYGGIVQVQCAMMNDDLWLVSFSVAGQTKL